MHMRPFPKSDENDDDTLSERISFQIQLYHVYLLEITALRITLNDMMIFLELVLIVAVVSSPANS
jgi:hypothetical protein